MSLHVRSSEAVARPRRNVLSYETGHTSLGHYKDRHVFEKDTERDFERKERERDLCNAVWFCFQSPRGVAGEM